jgi:hypothetical protein
MGKTPHAKTISAAPTSPKPCIADKIGVKPERLTFVLGKNDCSKKAQYVT